MLIERYLQSEIAKPFAAGFGMLIAIFIAFSTAVKLSEAAAGEIASFAVVQLIFLSAVIALEVLVPTTLYLTVLYAIGRLYRDSEMAALAAAGIGEARVLRTVFKIGLLASAVVLLLSVYGRPWAYARSYTLEQSGTSRFDLANIPPSTFVQFGEDGHVLFAREVDLATQRLRRVFVQIDQARGAEIISASSARIIGMDNQGSRAIEFYNGTAYLLDKGGRRDISMRFHTFLLHLPEEERISRYRRKAIDTGTLRHSDLPKDVAEYQWRLTAPVATLLLTLLAVPLSRANPRQSRVGSFAIAILAYLMLFTATGIVRTWLEDGDIGPFPGLLLAYLPSALLLLLLLALPRLSMRGWR